MVSPEEKQARQFAMLCHLSALAGLVVPFGNIVGPLAVWLWKRNDSPFIDDQGREAVNFQITMTIAMVIAFILIFVVIGIPLILVLGLAWIILVIMAAIKASNGESYRYPLTLRLVK